MGKEVTDAQIDASVREAQQMLEKLDLTDAERAWAKEQAKAVFKAATDAVLDEGLTVRALVVPAALAYALVIARDWAQEADKLKPNG